MQQFWDVFLEFMYCDKYIKARIEDEMVGGHHWLDGHEFEQAPGVGDGQGSLACCNLWGRKESDTTEQLNWADSQFLIEQK